MIILTGIYFLCPTKSQSYGFIPDCFVKRLRFLTRKGCFPLVLMGIYYPIARVDIRFAVVLAACWWAGLKKIQLLFYQDFDSPSGFRNALT